MRSEFQSSSYPENGILENYVKPLTVIIVFDCKARFYNDRNTGKISFF